MKFLLFFLCFWSLSAFGQSKILFWNESAGSNFSLEEGAFIRLRYNGYLLQESFVKGKVVSITDSSIVVQKRKYFTKYLTEILIKDISGIRIYSSGRLLTEAFVKLTIAAGGIILTAFLFTQPTISPLLASVTGAATGLLGRSSLNFIFSNKIKYNLNNEWNRVVM